MSAAELFQHRRPRLTRVAFTTSRLIEFCSQRELTAQTGHGVADWPLVILKELIDNAVDAAEEADVAPEIEISVSTTTGEITIADNGPGIPARTIRDVLNFQCRVSAREAYVSPSRGAQGNALKTILAMPFALIGTSGSTTVETQGKRHIITFRVDQLRQEPVVDHDIKPLNFRKKGTRITVRWPHSASSILTGAETRFLQIADDFAWLNPHLRILVAWNDRVRIDRPASTPYGKSGGPAIRHLPIGTISAGSSDT
jgi:DNA topoisomerase VI subunit B